MVKTTTTPAPDAEDTVRRFMLFIEDPSQLIDQAAVDKYTKAVADATDPIDKLKAMADLDKAKNIDEGPLRDGFVKVAKAYADAEGLPTTVFQHMKVSDDVLKDAGFEITTPTKTLRTRNGTERQRAKSVPLDDIKAWIGKTTSTFILNDVISGIGGSPATVRLAITEMTADGKVENLGVLPNYTGRGRAPLHYQLKK